MEQIMKDLASLRKMWIDGLRAIAMILVIFGYQVKGLSAYFINTSSIKTPVLFIITGYVFNIERTGIGIELLAIIL